MTTLNFSSATIALTDDVDSRVALIPSPQRQNFYQIFVAYLFRWYVLYIDVVLWLQLAVFDHKGRTAACILSARGTYTILRIQHTLCSLVRLVE